MNELEEPYLLTEAMVNTAAILAGSLATLTIWGLGFVALRALWRRRPGAR